MCIYVYIIFMCNLFPFANAIDNLMSAFISSLLVSIVTIKSYKREKNDRKSFEIWINKYVNILNEKHINHGLYISNFIKNWR